MIQRQKRREGREEFGEERMKPGKWKEKRENSEKYRRNYLGTKEERGNGRD